MNPPLRRDEDVHALRAALADGTIDIVATDHAPHPLESKECAWQEASFGMVGLESALSVVQQAVVDTGQLYVGGRRARAVPRPGRDRRGSTATPHRSRSDRPRT